MPPLGVSLDVVWLLNQATTSASRQSVSCCLTGDRRPRAWRRTSREVPAHPTYRWRYRAAQPATSAPPAAHASTASKFPSSSAFLRGPLGQLDPDRSVVACVFLTAHGAVDLR